MAQIRKMNYLGPTVDVKLPWPEVAVPKYNTINVRNWRIVKTPPTKLSSFGYYRPFIKQSAGHMLQCGKQGAWTVWMSLTMMEQESHMPHIAAARGHVLVAGLGMGMYLFNILRKPEVLSVIVIEHDPNIIRILRQATDLELWPGYEKLTVIEADALSYSPSFQPDFFYADIWPIIGASEALSDTQHMQENIRAKQVGYWTQEFDFAFWLMEKKIRFEQATDKHWKRFVADTKLPLIGAEFPGYNRLAVTAVIISTAISKNTSPLERSIILANAVSILSAYNLETQTNEII